MRPRTKILSALLFCFSAVSAQKVDVSVSSHSVDVRKDSAVVSMSMALSASDIDAKGYVRLTPLLTGGGKTESLPAVVMNGKQAQRLYLRKQALNRKKSGGAQADFAVLDAAAGTQSVSYRASVRAASWMSFASVSIRKEVFSGKGKKLQSEIVAVGAASLAVSDADADVSSAESESVVQTSSQSSSSAVGKTVFKGSYVSPESDATDERNQKELNFSLDEARVIANMNPQMLSLRELYTVALSYKATPEKFYKIIDTSVKIYPASPVANLNAAAAAIERGNVQSAGRYLQMANHESLAYKNCRGAYELMCNNTYEGIRLLKAAKAAGSEEAAYNLKMFFDSNR